MARKANRQTRGAATPNRPRPARALSPTRAASSAPAFAPAPGMARVWFLAARPKTLPAALGPILLGTALAVRAGEFAFGPALAAALCALLLQIGSNFANDYFDHLRGADTPDRLGPLRATANRWVSPTQMRNATFIALGLAALIGLYLVSVGGWPILVAGIAALLAAVAYTGGPFPYGYRGLGDIFVFIFFGLVAVNGTYYLQTGEITSLSLLVSVCTGALITAILVVNNLRDLETDRRAGKRTLAVIFGKKVAQIEYVALMLLAYLGNVLAWGLTSGTIFLLLPLASLPLAIRHIQEIWSDNTRAYNDTLAGTARLSLFYSLLFSAGLLM